MDSGCSFHICPNRSLFSSLNMAGGGKVLIGNNMLYSVKGIGAIMLKLHDGTYKMLQDVRFIPELKRNLISLGMLDSCGHSFRAEDGVLKVLKGFMVIMKGVRQNGLYVLEGTTISGDLAAVVDQDIDKMMIWHMRLRYLGEKGLKELSKQGLLGVHT